MEEAIKAHNDNLSRKDSQSGENYDQDNLNQQVDVNLNDQKEYFESISSKISISMSSIHSSNTKPSNV